MLFTATFGVLANMAMAAVVFGPSIIGTMFRYPFMSAQEKDNLMIQEGNENLNIRTVMAHINGDLIYSIGVLIGAIAINMSDSLLILDPLLTILFSFVVLHITIPVFRDSMTYLFEANPDVEVTDKISSEIYALDKVNKINKINSLRVWALTQDQRCATVHLTVEGDVDEQSLQHKIGKILQANDIQFVTIQVWRVENNSCPYNDEFV
jgi:cation diffusion facilitator family transporter